MAEDQTPNDPSTDNSSEDSKDPKWYRDQLAKEQAEKKDLAEKVLSQAFQMAGIDTSKGLGATMRKHYDGEADAAAIQRWAAENYEWTPPKSDGGGIPPAQDTLNQTINQGEERQEEVGGSGGGQSSTDDQLRAQIAQAEKDKNWSESIRLKQILTARMVQSGQIRPS